MASISLFVSFIVDLRDLDSLCSGEGAGHQGLARLLSYRVGAAVLENRGSKRGFLGEQNEATGAVYFSGRSTTDNRKTADGNGLGPGLCSYDANSDTGVLLVITTVTKNGTDIEFSLRTTGVHP
jgi:hypothetical protein